MSAISKGGDITESVLARRYCDAYIAIEGLVLGDLQARENLLNGLAPGILPADHNPFSCTRIVFGTCWYMKRLLCSEPLCIAAARARA